MRTNNIRITYRCKKSPETAQLKDFKENNVYEGRTFNNLYEISAEWASHKPTFILDQRNFEKYFELLPKEAMVQAGAGQGI